MATQAERTTATRRKVLDSARDLFATRGWANTSIDDILRSAGVTKGALYHHFPDKVALLRAVYEEQEEQLVPRLIAASRGQPDAVAALHAGCRAFLKVCTEPTFRRIALVEAPAGLGWEEWRAIDARYGFGLLRSGVEAAVRAGQLKPLPVDQLAHLVLAALTEAALVIGESTTPRKSLRELEATFAALLDGLRVAT
jgi:AcrR family transcriptional regulator